MTFATINNDTSHSINQEELARLALIGCDQSYAAGTPTLVEGVTPLARYEDPVTTPVFYEAQIATSGFRVEKVVTDNGTGFKAVIYKNATSNEVMVAFGGTDGTNPIDWQGNVQHYGWNQWEAAKTRAGYFDALNAVLGPNFAGKLHFTGQSLGGALAQYAAYDYVREHVLNAPPGQPFDASNVTLTTFNALGGIAALKEKGLRLNGTQGYDASVLAGLGSAVHYVVANDLVHLLGAGHAGGYVATFDWRADASAGLNAQGIPYRMGVVESHRIESAFYQRLNAANGFFSAGYADVPYLQIDSLQALASRFGNPLRTNGTSSIEAALSLIAGTLPALTLAPRGSAASSTQGNMLIWAVADIEHEAGLSDSLYRLIKGVDWDATAKFWGVALAVASPLSLLKSYVGSIILGKLATGLGMAVDAAAAVLRNVFSSSTIPGADVPLSNGTAAEKGAQFDMLMQADPSQTNAAGQPYAVSQLGMSPEQKEGYAKEIATGSVQSVYAYVENIADDKYSGKELTEKVLLAVSEIEASAIKAVGTDTAKATQIAQTTIDFLKQFGYAVANANTDYQADRTTSLSPLPAASDFASVKALVDGFTAGLSKIDFASWFGITSAQAAEVEDLRQTVVEAGQTIILRPGTGPNPFDAVGGAGDVNTSAPASINERGTATFTVYLPYEVGKDGQRIRLQLTGNAASAFDVVAASGAHPVGPDGTFDLLIHEGQKQITFALAEIRDVDASETLGLSAGLIGSGGAPTHSSHLEVNLSLTAVNEPIAVPPASTVTGTANGDFMSSAGINGAETVAPWQAPIAMIQGLEGNDFIERLHSGDETFGGDGNDWITGDDDGRFPGREQRVDGGEGNDLISSVGGGGSLKGGDGNDLIDGSSRWYYQIDGHTQVGDWAILAGIFSPDFKPATYRTHISDGNGGTTYFQATDLGSWRARQDGTLTLEMRAGYADATGGATSGGWRWTTTTTNDVTTIEFVQLSTGSTARWTVESAKTPIEHQKSLTLDGGDDNDALVGTDQEDMIVGGAGSDLIEAGVGTDTVFGDIALDPSPNAQPDGNDQIALGAGDDYALAGGGNDLVWAETGSDTVFGGAGNDVLFGDNGLGGPDGADFLDGGADNDILYGAAGADTLTGGTGNDILLGDHAFNTAAEMAGDVLDGGDGDDKLWGYGGNDQLIGGSGSDVLVGGTGLDSLDGGDGADQLWGQQDNDTLAGGQGDDFMDGGAGADVMHGGDGADQMWGEQSDVSEAASGDDTIYGEGGNDSIVGGAGNDLLDGGADNDGIWAGVGNDTILGGSGDDGLFGEDGNDTLSGGEGTDTLNGGAGDDQLDGGAGDDALRGGDGADLMTGGAGTDYLEGGSGADTYSFRIGDGPKNAAGQAETVVDSDSTSTFEFEGGVSRTDVIVRQAGATNNLTVLYGGTDGFVLRDGLSLANATFRFSDGSTATLSDMLDAGLNGTSGDDSILAHSGRNNVIHGGSGNDLISGQSGNDTLYGDDGDDRLSAGAGDDILYGGAGNDQLTGGSGTDVLDGGTGNDILFSGNGSYTVVFGRGYGHDCFSNTGNISAQTTNRVDLAQGISPADILVRHSTYGELVLTINGTSDRLDISNYFSQASGGPIPIRFFDGTTWDTGTVIAKTQLPTPGDDFLIGFQSAVTIDGGDGNDTIYGSAFENHLAGGNGDDQLYGGPVIDFLQGGTGNDTLLSGEGDDSLDGGEGDDQLTGGPGNDLLLGGGGNDALDGSEGDDTLKGGSGFDVLVGGDGADTLDGGEYQDVMSGGQGSDTYIFGRGSGQDTIYNGQDFYTYPPFDYPGYFYDFDPLGVSPDKILMGADLAPSDIGVQKSGNDLLLSIVGASDVLTVHNYFASAATTSSAVEEIRFSNGVAWSPDDLKAAVTRGTPGDDTIEGFSTNDTLSGGDGMDSIRGLLGDDSLDGGNGNDWLDGGDGNDSLFGGGDNDHLDGGFGDDILTGGAGSDDLMGGPGSDVYRFGRGAGQDTINNYRIDNAPDSIQLDAGVSPGDLSVSRVGGDLLISIKGTSDSLRCQQYFADGGFPAYPIELIRFADGTAWDQAAVAARLLPMNLVGTIRDDYLVAGDLNDSLVGLEGNDTLDGGAGSDAMVGGAGNDTYLVDRAPDVYLTWDVTGYLPVQPAGQTGPWDSVTENAGEGTDTVVSSVSYQLGPNVENLTLTGSGYLTAVGNELNNVLIGSDGDDQIFGGGGADDMRGGRGNDTYVVAEIGDTITEQADGGQDTVISDISYQLGENVEDLMLAGVGNVNGTGNALPNVIWGNGGSNSLYGLAGDDQLNEYLGGSDTLDGGIGNDFYGIWEGATGVKTISSTDATPGKTDTLHMEFDSLAATVVRVAADLEFTFAGSTATVVVQNYFAPTNPTLVERFEFANGIVWMPADVVAKLPVATEGDDHIVGTAGGDTINALGGNDVVDAGDGDDFVDGGAGSDVLNGQNGIDRLVGGIGNDTLDGGSGADTMIGGAGDDVYVVSSAGDVVTENAGEGADTVRSSVGWTLGANVENLTLTGSANINGSGNTLNNTLAGNSGNNVLDGGVGADSMAGGLGDDSYVVDNAADVVTENASEGTDLVQSSVSHILGSNVENLTLTGATSLNGTGNALNNTLTGNGADNVLDGGAGNDTLVGGAGNDTYVVDSAADIVTEAASAGTDTVRSSVTLTLAANVENLVLTGTTAINGAGNALNNALTGNAANNVLDGGAGTDTLVGGAGNDTYIVDASTDVVTEVVNEGTDLVQSAVTYTLGNNIENLTLTGTAAINGTGNALNNTVTGNAMDNKLDGGTGADTMLGSAGNDTYVVDATGDVVTENPGEGTDLVQSSVTYTLSANVENLTLTGTSAIYGTGNALDNILIGNNANNTLTGGDGNDTINGGSGTDTMVGGLGNDAYTVDVATDVVTEAASSGTDTVLSSVTLTLAANVENLTLTGTSAINGTGNTLDNVLVGNSANNTLTGGDGNDTLDGGAGTDTLVGGLGNDTYVVDVATDVVTEAASAGTDTVLSSVTLTLATNVENLILTGTGAINGTGNSIANLVRGNSAVNTLNGGTGNDLLEGGDGNDVLNDTSGTAWFNGGAGTDTVTGGASAEIFVGGLGNDTINTGNGADIILYNKGEGSDTINGGTGTDNVLSLGGGLRYADLKFRKVSNDLVMDVSATESIAFKNWYLTTANNKAVSKLQVILEATADYNAASSDPTLNKKVEQFDFAGLVTKFDQARAANVSLTSWALTNALSTYYLASSSDSAALGGDLGYYYGLNGNVTGMTSSAAQDVVGSASLGTANQTLRPLAGISGGGSTLQ